MTELLLPGLACNDPEADDVPAWNLVVADLRREVLLLHAALGEVLAWGVVLDDPRLDYLEVQVSRGAVDYARDVLAGREPPP